MRRIHFMLPLLLTLWAAAPAPGSILVMDGLDLDLTKPADQKRVLRFSTDLDGQSNNSFQDIAIETATLPIGTAWRTVTGVSVSATVTTLRPLPDWNGRTHLYLRYSPDYRHWSDWQDIHRTNSAGPPGMEQTFEGSPAVPAVSRFPYDVLLREHQRITRSNDDEGDDIRWILTREPHFFENCLPFMGYIQFLFEADIEPGQQVCAIHIRYNWGVSGLTQQSGRKRTREEEEDRKGPWHFKA